MWGFVRCGVSVKHPLRTQVKCSSMNAGSSLNESTKYDECLVFCRAGQSTCYSTLGGSTSYHVPISEKCSRYSYSAAT